MYNKLNNYSTTNNISFSKFFRFRAGKLTDHAVVELVDDITNGFIENKYILGVFIELSKAFDNVNHFSLLEKLRLCGVEGKTLQWFKSYLSRMK